MEHSQQRTDLTTAQSTLASDFFHTKSYDPLPVKQRGAATFGRPDGANRPLPKEFLRTRHFQLPEPVRPVAPKPRRKERVPAHGERPMMGLSSNRNFITCNALEVIRARPPPTDVQEYSYVCKPDFGRVPTYLTAARQRLQREKEEQDVAAAEAARQDAEARGVAMSKEERAELLALLKGKWGVLNAAFQRLPMTLDTPSKRRRKEVLEAQLAQTEHDIQLLQNAVTVLIRNDLHQNSYT